MGIIERIGAFSGTEAAKAINTAHAAFQDRMGRHGHHGRALLESLAEVCRNHPNIVGIAAGLLVEQLLVHEKHHHDAEVAAGHVPPRPAEPPPGDAPLHLAGQAHPEHHLHMPAMPALRLDQLRPGKLAMEVFGALILLKFSAGVARALRKKAHRQEIWFAPAARIHLFSGALATYYIARSLKAKKVSAWRNAFAALFFTDAIKPLLKARRRKGGMPPLDMAAAPQAAPQQPAAEPAAPQAAAAPVEPYRFPDPHPMAAGLAGEPPAGHA